MTVRLQPLLDAVVAYLPSPLDVPAMKVCHVRDACIELCVSSASGC